MSYCRFSSDNFKSDVYVYEGHKHIIHVAASKHAIAPIPNMPFAFTMQMCKWAGVTASKPGSLELHYPSKWKKKVLDLYFALTHPIERLHHWSVRNFPTKAIGLPHDGAYFECKDAKACYNKLMELQAIGYHVPQYAMDALLQESMEDMLERIEE